MSGALISSSRSEAPQFRKDCHSRLYMLESFFRAGRRFRVGPFDVEAGRNQNPESWKLRQEESRGCDPAAAENRCAPKKPKLSVKSVAAFILSAEMKYMLSTRYEDLGATRSHRLPHRLSTFMTSLAKLVLLALAYQCSLGTTNI